MSTSKRCFLVSAKHGGQFLVSWWRNQNFINIDSIDHLKQYFSTIVANCQLFWVSSCQNMAPRVGGRGRSVNSTPWILSRSFFNPHSTSLTSGMTTSCEIVSPARSGFAFCLLLAAFPVLCFKTSVLTDRGRSADAFSPPCPTLTYIYPTDKN